MWVALKEVLEQQFADAANKIKKPSASSFPPCFPCNSLQVQIFGPFAQPVFLIFPGEVRIWPVNRSRSIGSHTPEGGLAHFFNVT